MLTLDKVYHAAFVLKDVARKTDLIEAPKLSKDCQLYLKTENLQATGSFKVRGAYYKISQLSKEESEKGVIACSAGNHAQGVALAATRRGIKSIVCMPDGAPIMKVENTKSLGAEVCLVPGTYDDAHDKAVELQAETGMTFIHPYDDEQVIAGQGTIGLEILDQLPDVDAVIVPVGGGGLISGVAFAIKSLKPDVKVYGVQAEGAPSMYRSLHEHKYQTLSAASTFADGIQVKTPGELTYQLCEEYVDDIVTVTEDETAAAILSLMECSARGSRPLPQAAHRGQKGRLRHLRRQHRREHPQPRHYPRSGHERPQSQPDHRTGGQARPAQEGGRDRLPLRQQRRLRPARWLRPQHAHLQLLPQAGIGDPRPCADRADPHGADQGRFPARRRARLILLQKGSARMGTAFLPVLTSVRRSRTAR